MGRVKKNEKPKGRTPMIGFRLDSRVRAALEREAAEHERDMSWLIRAYIEAGLGLRQPVPLKNRYEVAA